MAAFLQKTSRRLSGTAPGNQQLGPLHGSDPGECWGPPAAGGGRADGERGTVDGKRGGGGPRQQQGGAQRIHRRDPSDLRAQQHHRPGGLGGGGGGAGAQRTPPKQNGRPNKLPGRLREQEAGWSKAVEGNQRLLLLE